MAYVATPARCRLVHPQRFDRKKNPIKIFLLSIPFRPMRLLNIHPIIFRRISSGDINQGQVNNNVQTGIVCFLFATVVTRDGLRSNAKLILNYWFLYLFYFIFTGPMLVQR